MPKHTAKPWFARHTLDGQSSEGTNKKKTRVVYSERYVRELLRLWGFSPQKPAYVAYEQSPEHVRMWVEKEYPALRKRATTKHGIILWLDETGIRSQHAAGRSYSVIGNTPMLKKTGKRFYCNVISVLSNAGRMFFTVLRGGFNAQSLLVFLQRLIQSVNKKIFLVADAHPAHRAIAVQQWLANHSAKIEMSFLPAYAPQLNADEYFNQHLKTNGTGKKHPQNKEELVQITRAFCQSVQRKPNLVKSFFNPQDVRYARRYTKLPPD